MVVARTRKRRTRLLLAATVLALGVAAAACGPAGPAGEAAAPGCPTAPPDAITSTIFNQTNADRAAYGHPGLAWNARLACLASGWSQSMAGNGALAHRDLAATINSPGFETYTGLAENIFVGPGTVTGDAIEGAWMHSPLHFDNIMGNYDSIGIGWAKSADGRLWATENFGRHG